VEWVQLVYKVPAEPSRKRTGATGGQNADLRLAQARAKLEACADEVQRRENITTGRGEAVPAVSADGQQTAWLTAPKPPDVRGGDPTGSATSD
jgi:hypothetical protein